MSSFNDATCENCGKRFGWQGSVLNKPPCPKCGQQTPKEELEKLEKEIDKMKEKMMREIFEKE